MSNTHIYSRLHQLLERLQAVHAATQSVPISHRGRPAEGFINTFLSETFPSAFRFEPGEVTDSAGHRSGPLDVLVESPFVPCLPPGGEQQNRLHLAEGILAAIQVRANLMTEWESVLQAARQLAPLRRQFTGFSSASPAPTKRIPLFAVGYGGWETPDTLHRLLRDTEVDAVLIIEPALFASMPAFGGTVARGPWALWAFLCCLQQAISGQQAAGFELMPYARENPIPRPIAVPPPTAGGTTTFIRREMERNRCVESGRAWR